MVVGQNNAIKNKGPSDNERNKPIFSSQSERVALQLTVVTRTIARSGVAESEKDALAASVVPSAAGVHETTAVRALSSNGP